VCWGCCFSPLIEAPTEDFQEGILSIIQITTEEDITLITGIIPTADTNKTTTTWVETFHKTTTPQRHKLNKKAVGLLVAGVPLAAAVLQEVGVLLELHLHAGVVHREVAIRPQEAVGRLVEEVLPEAVVVAAEEEVVAEEDKFRFGIQDLSSIENSQPLSS
jgi:hypothetical protein